MYQSPAGAYSKGRPQAIAAAGVGDLRFHQHSRMFFAVRAQPPSVSLPTFLLLRPNSKHFCGDLKYCGMAASNKAAPKSIKRTTLYRMRAILSEGRVGGGCGA